MNSLSFMTPINRLSYGYAGWNICRQLIKQGIDVTLFPINTPTHADFDDPSDVILIQKNHHKEKIYNNEAPAIKLWHQFDLDLHVNTKGPHYSFPIFELDQLSEREKSHCNANDYLITCSEWGRQVLIKETNKSADEIFNVPLGVDPTVFYPTPSRQDDKCIFLSIGKIEIRKLSDLLPDIFAKAFTKTDNVELWMSFKNIFLTESDKQDWLNLYKNSPLGDKIKIVPRLNTQKDMAALINEADYLIQLSRCEGFSLPSIEGLACGKFVLAGDYGGQADFLDTANAYLVDIDEFEIAYDGKFFKNNIGRWASFKEKQIEQTVEHLRAMYKRKMERGTVFNQYGVTTAQEFTWENSAKKLVEILFK